ncbi:hypothetical protein ACFLWL_03175 [Chloroflexota bacterium]
MKIRWTRRVVGIIVAYLVVCAIIVYLGDFVFTTKLAFLPNVIVGLLTILGGFLLAYWLIESARFSRDLERKKRVKRVLKSFKNYLLPWLYHYAALLSERPEINLKASNNLDEIVTGKYKDDIPQLKESFHNVEFLKIPFYVDNLHRSLEWGLRELGRIEGRIREFPAVLEEINPEVAKIVHISAYMRERINELDKWDCIRGEKADHTIDNSNFSDYMNLRILGDSVLEIVKAIDANLDQLEDEL